MATTVFKGPVTGSEPSSVSSRDPYHALINFYRAFNQRDLSLMTANWSPSEDVVMANPLGGVKRGWSEISAVYTRLFRGAAQVYVEFYDFSVLCEDAMFCATGRERGYFRHNGKQTSLAIRTSRVYRMEAQQWRQVHHHGSIDDPRILDAYQSAVAQVG
jgi:hypothetical protein